MFLDASYPWRMNRTVKMVMLGFLLLFPVRGFAQALPSVSGTWLQKQVTTSVAKVPVAGKIESQAVAYIKVDIQQDGALLSIKSQTCWVELSSEFKKVRAYIPKPFMSLMKHVRTGSLRNDDGVIRFHQDMSVDVFGAKLDNKSKSELPTKAKDKTVIDHDDDGHPGVTVRTRGLLKGRIYVAQRNRTTLDGVVSKDKINGHVKWRTEQKVLGASNPFLKKDPNASPHPDQDKSRFKMVRADGAKSCDDALKFRSNIQ